MTLPETVVFERREDPELVGEGVGEVGQGVGHAHQVCSPLLLEVLGTEEL